MGCWWLPLLLRFTLLTCQLKQIEGKYLGRWVLYTRLVIPLSIIVRVEWLPFLMMHVVMFWHILCVCVMFICVSTPHRCELVKRIIFTISNELSEMLVPFERCKTNRKETQSKKIFLVVIVTRICLQTKMRDTWECTHSLLHFWWIWIMHAYWLMVNISSQFYGHMSVAFAWNILHGTTWLSLWIKQNPESYKTLSTFDGYLFFS